jgi:hypothetical protein
MGKQIEETHLEQVKNFLELFQPEVEAGELPTIESVLEYQTWLVTVKSTSAPAADRESALIKCNNIEGAILPYLHRADHAVTGRRAFRTRQGILGIGPPSMTEDDEIWMLHGGDVPFVLRPYYGAGDDRFKFISDCYLHGYTYGEKLREDPKLAEKIQPIVLV